VLIATLAPTLGALLGPTAPRAPHVADPAPAGRLASTVRRVLAPSVVLLVATTVGGAVLTIVPIARPSGYLATAALLVFGAASALCRWLAGGWADRRGTRGPLLAANLVMIGGVLALAGGLGGPSDVGLLAGATLIGAAFGAANSLILVWAFGRVEPGERPVASTVWNASFDAGTAVGAVLVGALAGTRLGVAGGVAVFAVLVAAVVPLGLRRPAR
jgi:predicted MFS family arabinose efflux permease